MIRQVGGWVRDGGRLDEWVAGWLARSVDAQASRLHYKAVDDPAGCRTLSLCLLYGICSEHIHSLQLQIYPYVMCALVYLMFFSGGIVINSSVGRACTMLTDVSPGPSTVPDSQELNESLLLDLHKALPANPELYSLYLNVGQVLGLGPRVGTGDSGKVWGLQPVVQTVLTIQLERI